MSGGPEGGPMGPMGPNTMGPVLNGDGLDGMKNSPANGGPGTPREDSGSGMGDYNLGGFGAPGENVSIHLFSLITSPDDHSTCCCGFVLLCTRQRFRSRSSIPMTENHTRVVLDLSSIHLRVV